MTDKQQMTPEILATRQGIHTVFQPGLNESYHSMYGSLQESMHVFIENGLNHVCLNRPIDNLRILEMGFGTGLNALLTFYENIRIKKTIHYSAVEAYPLSSDFIRRLNFFDFIPSFLGNAFFSMHQCPWFENTEIKIDTNPDSASGSAFFLYKILADMTELKPEGPYDLIYYDAFSPARQPELWTYEIFQNLYQSSADGAVLVTYSAKGEVKRMLKAAGFETVSLPGPKGKREMIRAIKK